MKHVPHELAQQLAEALRVAAPHHQGRTSKPGKAIGEALRAWEEFESNSPGKLDGSPPRTEAEIRAEAKDWENVHDVLDVEFCTKCRVPKLQLGMDGEPCDGPCRCDVRALAQQLAEALVRIMDPGAWREGVDNIAADALRVWEDFKAGRKLETSGMPISKPVSIPRTEAEVRAEALEEAAAWIERASVPIHIDEWQGTKKTFSAAVALAIANGVRALKGKT